MIACTGGFASRSIPLTLRFDFAFDFALRLRSGQAQGRLRTGGVDLKRDYVAVTVSYGRPLLFR